ncbi:MAG: hypothetical protein WAN35_04090 [Terracidiphilus sp.]
MKKMSCEHESEVIRALHTGEWSSALRLHAAACEDCSQALNLAEALCAEARHAEAAFHPPDAHWIIERSRRMAREIAMRRVAFLLAAMRTLAVVYVIAVVGWLLRGYAAIPYRELASAMSRESTWFAWMGAVVGLLSVAAGLWPILRDRSGQS